MNLTADSVSRLSTPGPAPSRVLRSCKDSSLLAVLHNDRASDLVPPAAVGRGAAAVVAVGAGSLVEFDSKVAPLIAPPGGTVGSIRHCVEDVGADGAVIPPRLATERADKPAVGACMPVFGGSFGAIRHCTEDVGAAVDGVISFRLATERADKPAVGVCRPGFGGSVGAIRHCVDDVGAAVDGVVISFGPATERADEPAVGVCGPVFGGFDCRNPKNLRSKSRFLGSPSGIFRDLR